MPKAAPKEEEIPPESLIFAEAISVWPRARLIALGGRGLQVEVRPAPLADLAAYIGHLSQMDDVAVEADMAILWPLLVIPSVYQPSYDAQGRWVPGASRQRVFTPNDVDRIGKMPSRAVEGIFGAVVELSGMHPEEQKAAGWRLINDGFFVTMFAIAEKLCMTVTELCQRMPSWEFQWWIAYWNYKAIQEDLAMHKPGDSTSAGGFAAR